jgi:hypothetical protein
MQSSPASCHFLPLRSKYSPQRYPVLEYAQSMFFPCCERLSNNTNYSVNKYGKVFECGLFFLFRIICNGYGVSDKSSCIALISALSVTILVVGDRVKWRVYYLPPICRQIVKLTVRTFSLRVFIVIKHCSIIYDNVPRDVIIS